MAACSRKGWQLVWMLPVVTSLAPHVLLQQQRGRRWSSNDLRATRRSVVEALVLISSIDAAFSPVSSVASAAIDASTTTTAIEATAPVSESLPSAATAPLPRPPQVTITPSYDVQITLFEPTRLGLELMDVTIGTPPRTVPALRSVPFATRTTASLQSGMILPDYGSAAAVYERLQKGPYPVTLVFRNLAAGGDAIADTGAPLVTAQDALNLARRNSGTTAATNKGVSEGGNFAITNLQSSPSICGIRSRRGDVLEVVYEARYGTSTVTAKNGPVYDSSLQRGTGQPYLMVLGSGDMLPGVDQGLYDMCPGDERGLAIPTTLAYGSKGNRLFAIPPNAALYWKVTLVSVNSVQAGDMRSRVDMEGRER